MVSNWVQGSSHASPKSTKTRDGTLARVFAGFRQLEVESIPPSPIVLGVIAECLGKPWNVGFHVRASMTLNKFWVIQEALLPGSSRLCRVQCSLKGRCSKLGSSVLCMHGGYFQNARFSLPEVHRYQNRRSVSRRRFDVLNHTDRQDSSHGDDAGFAWSAVVDLSPLWLFWPWPCQYQCSQPLPPNPCGSPSTFWVSTVVSLSRKV